MFFTFQETVCLKGRNQLRPSGRMRAGLCVDFTGEKQGREDQWGKSDSKESEPPAAAFTSQTFLYSSATPSEGPTDKDTTEGGACQVYFLGLKLCFGWVLIRARRNSWSCKTKKGALFKCCLKKKATHIADCSSTDAHLIVQKRKIFVKHRKLALCLQPELKTQKKNNKTWVDIEGFCRPSQRKRNTGKPIFWKMRLEMEAALCKQFCQNRSVPIGELGSSILLSVYK